MSNNIIDWIRLIRTENVGIRTFYSLLEIYGTPSEAIKYVADIARKGGRKEPIKIYPEKTAEAELKKAEKFGAKILCLEDQLYPFMLRQISDPPPVITAKGDIGLVSSPKIIGIVGARNAAINSCNFAMKIASDLGQKGVVITSGLARGIDTHAHKGALETGTIAVIAGGIDSIYPPENKSLYNLIYGNGLVITEQAFGAAPKAQHFPQRNRIISGISSGILVVEASFGSGSLISAKFALEQGREVFAVPGSPLDSRCKGTNHLIKQGAVMCESSDDILSNINFGLNIVNNAEEERRKFIAASLQPPEEDALSSARPIIIEALGSTPISVDELIVASEFSANIVLTILLELELAGRLERHSGNKVAMIYRI